MNKANECTCPSGDGSLVHPCPAHPAVEQVGGDERAAFELFVRKHCGMPAHIAVNWDAKFTNDAWEGWKARAALAQPSPPPHPASELDFSRPLETENGDPVKWICADVIEYKSARVCVAKDTGLVYSSPYIGLKIRNVMPEQAEAERPEGPTEDELEAAGLGYPLHKEEAVKLWYSGFRSEVITVLEAWEAIGHDIGMNPDKGELLDSLRYMLEKCEAHDAALARVAELERQQPVAWMHDQPNRVDVIHRDVKDLLQRVPGSSRGIYRPLDVSEHYTIPLYAAPVAQPEETPGEILAAKLIETWVTKHGKPAPWSTAVEITAVATNMPNDERERLLALDDDVDAQAQHSVPEGWMLVECGIWTQEQVDEMQKTVARFRNSEFVDDRALAMAVADAGQCKAPEISLAELLAAEAQALRDERDSQQRVAIKAMEELAALHARVVVVPERDARRMDTEYPEGWNDCLDELARINGMTVSEALLRRLCEPLLSHADYVVARNELRALLSEKEGGKP
ncbi:TPA: hypothetical protein SL252_006733 [Pseudomonas aeruginosa]|nr:hypothetical protein [Pseudomonas aeruginosa]